MSPTHSKKAQSLQPELPEPRAYVLTVNTTEIDPGSKRLIDQAIERAAQGMTTKGTWRITANRKSIKPGDRVFMLQQVREQGLVAIGQALGGALPGQGVHVVKVEWQQWLPSSARIAARELMSVARHTKWKSFRNSGRRVDPRDVENLERLFGLGPIEVDAGPGGEYVDSLSEGEVKIVKSKRYERNLATRRRCIERSGARCAVCDMSFSDTYGKFAEGFIHVHHAFPVSQMKIANYRFDPDRDLVAVCPNCHAMLHHGRKQPRSVSDLRRIMKR